MVKALNRSSIVQAAFSVLDEEGLQGLTLRAVSRRLGVQHNAVRWHVDGKSRLVELMTDAMLDGCCDAPLPDDWHDRSVALFERLRSAFLSHRDGAALAAGVTTDEPNTLLFAETSIATLTAGGVSMREAVWTHFALFYFTLGLTQEEQTPHRPTAAGTGVGARHPVLESAAAHLATEDFDARFDFGVRLVLRGLPPA